MRTDSDDDAVLVLHFRAEIFPLIKGKDIKQLKHHAAIQIDTQLN